ncbi:MAG: family 20 glycosylhydrolase [Myxococcota bacterium]
MSELPLFAGPETTPIRMRGLHLDPCRHFIEVDTVLNIIAMMARLRLNTLHLHLSDDQSIPVEFASVPAIVSTPRWSIADQEAIAAACRTHGIQVIPEIDIPGHAKAFLSFFDPTIEPEPRLGVVTTETIDMERDLPTVLAMFAELVERFDAQIIHMGGDESKNYARFPELITRVCDWASERGLSVMAWDDVLTALDEDAIPDNFIAHRWRFRTSPTIAQVPTVQSWGYYLDHVDDPFTYYNRHPQMWGENLGCIACMWTELVTDQTIMQTIFPSLYMIAHRWWTYPERVLDQPPLLRQLCEAYGYPEGPDRDGWKSRRWVGFYKDDPRSTTSVSVHDVLDREEDLVPAFSRALVIVADALYRSIHNGDTPTQEERATLARLGQDCYGDDLDFLWERGRGWRKKWKQTVRSRPDSKLTHNGLVVAVRRAIRGPYKEKPSSAS